MIKNEILNLCEGRFEKFAKGIVDSRIEKALEKYGLSYNGGDPIYNTKKNNATLVSFGLNKNGKFYNLVNEYIALPKEKEAFLEYNLRTKSFRISFLDYSHKEGDANFPKHSSIELPRKFNNEFAVKEIIPLILKYKAKFNNETSQAINHSDYDSALKYAHEHNLQKEESLFNY